MNSEHSPNYVSYPHCDSEVLHAPNECEYCDRFPALQADRILNKINFTGHNDPGKEKCPAEVRRDIEKIYNWYGNVPSPSEEEDYLPEYEFLDGDGPEGYDCS